MLSGSFIQDRQNIAGAGFPREHLATPQTGRTQSRGELVIDQHLFGRRSDGRWISWIDEQGSIARQLLETVRFGRDDGGTARHCLGNRNRERLLVGWV